MATDIEWVDLAERTELFTTRDSMMIDLDTGKALIHYSANTKIRFAQAAMIDGELYLRTESAKSSNLNRAVKASSFDWPVDKAPSVLLGTSQKTLASYEFAAPKTKSEKRKIVQKQTKEKSHNDGGGSIKRLFKKLFRR